LLSIVSVSRSATASDKKACVAAYEAAQVERDTGRLVDSRAHLAYCASDDCPQALRGDCLGWLSEVDARLPTIVLRIVTRSGHDVLEATAAVDGGVPIPIDGRPVSLDPGPHEIHASVARQSVVERIVVAEGERGRIVVLPPIADLADAEAEAPRDRVERAELRSSPTPSGPQRENSRTVWGILSAGVAAETFGVATYLYVLGLNDRSALKARCGGPSSCSSDAADGARAKLVAGDVFAGLGIVLVGVAAYLLWAPR
jgi:hypothetical protein